MADHDIHPENLVEGKRYRLRLDYGGDCIKTVQGKFVGISMDPEGKFLCVLIRPHKSEHYNYIPWLRIKSLTLVS